MPAIQAKVTSTLSEQFYSPLSDPALTCLSTLTCYPLPIALFFFGMCFTCLLSFQLTGDADKEEKQVEGEEKKPAGKL